MEFHIGRTKKWYAFNNELEKVLWIYSNPSIYVAVGCKKDDVNRIDGNQISYCSY